jgi:hypothetical protein
MFDTENKTDVSENSGQPSEADGGAAIQQPDDVTSPERDESSFENKFKAKAYQAMEKINAPAPGEAAGEAEPEKAEGEGEDPPPEVEKTEEEKEEELKDEPKKEKSERTTSYNSLKQEVETFRTEREQIDKDLAAVGGREGLSYISNLLGAFSSPNEKFTVSELNEAGETVEREVTGKDLIYEFVNGTPEADGIYSEFFIKGLENEENRVFAVNDVLKQEFSLSPDVNLTPDQLNSVFGYLAAQLNLAKTPEERAKIFEEFDFKTKGLDYDPEEFTAQQENERLKAEIERLKNPQAAKESETEDPVQKVQKHYEEVLADEQKRYAAEDNLMIEKFTTVSTQFLSEYGLGENPSDAPEIKEAKQLLGDLILGKSSIAQKIRFSPAFKSAAGYLHKGTLTKTHLGTIAGNNLDNAMRAQVSTLLKTLAPLFGSKPAAPAKPKTGESQNGNRANIQANSKEPSEKKDFRSAAEKHLDRTVPKF